MKLPFRILTIILSLAVLAGCAGMRSAGKEKLVFYVSPSGNDAWSGRRAAPDSGGSDGPFATLERARDAVRALRASGKWPKHGVTVFLREGTYELSKTLRLSGEDSGLKGAPVVWRPRPGELVRLVGGKRIGNFRQVTEPAVLKRLDIMHRREIFVTNLRLQNIWNYGKLTPRGFSRENSPAALELFFNGKPMTLSRWPNEGWETIAGIAGEQFEPTDVRSTVKSQVDTFIYGDDRPNRWADTSDIWVHGYWTWDWADSYEHVKSIDTSVHSITTFAPHGVYGYRENRRYYYLNILEELDSPGEWYLDRKTTMLYFWPPAPLAGSEIFVSLLEEPLIALENASNVTVRGMILETTRGNAVEITGGSDNCIAGCTIRNIGNVGVIIRGGTRNGVLSSDIYETGDGGIVIDGGDRTTLKPAGNYAVNNHIHDYSRWVRTYRPAVHLFGVGNRVAHNLIHDAPHTGVLFWGNDHILEYNEVHDICRETGDVGAFYIGRDWTMRGNVLRYNFFHHLHGPGHGGARAVYLDDCASENSIYGNIFYQASMGAFIGGGRDNTVENNIFVECDPAVHIDGRGIGWASVYIVKGGEWKIFEKLDAVNYRHPPYSRRYPKLVGIMEDDPALPKGNKIARNIAFGGRWLNLEDGIDSLKINTISDNFVGDPGFVNLKGMDFRMRKGSPALKTGFTPIPYEKIGLYRDNFRMSAPRGLK